MYTSHEQGWMSPEQQLGAQRWVPWRVIVGARLKELYNVYGYGGHAQVGLSTQCILQKKWLIFSLSTFGGLSPGCFPGRLFIDLRTAAAAAAAADTAPMESFRGRPLFLFSKVEAATA